MKGKLAVALAVMAATVLLVVLLCTHPAQPPVQPVPAPPLAMPAQPAAPITPPAVMPPAQPVPPQDDLAAIDERLRDAIPQLPMAHRLARWWQAGRPLMPEAEYEAARALYMRFLDNFARIKTAQFKVERFETQEDGTERLVWTADVVWAASGLYDKQRVESIDYEDEAETRLVVSNGHDWVAWEQGEVRTRGENLEGYGRYYLHRYEMAAIQASKPFFLNYYEHCELDDGSTGYSRVWGEKYGAEVRFDTATNLLVENNLSEYRRDRTAYQQVNGIWFPRETTIAARWEDGPGNWVEQNIRMVFTDVVLNEAVDESLFDVNKPFFP